jgi:D-aminopeptidase
MVRARDIGIAIGRGVPGPHDAITDVAGVRVGYATLIEGSDVRTGVTVIMPFDGPDALFAGAHRLNGNGEMTGLQWVEESGLLTSPIAITNTYSVGAVHCALVSHWLDNGGGSGEAHFALPVVAETYDGRLNDIAGQHVKAEHVDYAIAHASGGPIEEGNVGGGTGMICHGFKGGTGTASRVVGENAGSFTVGVLVQANHGRRARLRVNGVPVGEHISPSAIPMPATIDSPDGSIIIVVATDAPLLPGQCKRLAQRAALGVGRTGGLGENTSGDLIIAFATGNRNLMTQQEPPVTRSIRMLSDRYIDQLFEAVVDGTEEAILNALLGAETMSGKDGMTAYRLDPDLLAGLMARSGSSQVP